MTVGPLGKILRKHFLTLPRRSQWVSDPRRETRLSPRFTSSLLTAVVSVSLKRLLDNRYSWPSSYSLFKRTRFRSLITYLPFFFFFVLFFPTSSLSLSFSLCLCSLSLCLSISLSIYLSLSSLFLSLFSWSYSSCNVSRITECLPESQRWLSTPEEFLIVWTTLHFQPL